MAKLKKIFASGIMNKQHTARLIPHTEYIDALNVVVNSTEGDDNAAVELSLGNTQLTTLEYDGEELSSSARAIGKFSDDANETMYWFVHDPSFGIGSTGKCDMVVSHNTRNGDLRYHVVSIDDGGGSGTTLNFNPTYLITAVNLIDNMLIWNDGLNEPRQINVNRTYDYPSIGPYIDQFDPFDIKLIKSPPTSAPTLNMTSNNLDDKFIEDRFLSFSYRYKYADGQKSATGPWSLPAFQPSFFSLSEKSNLNNGMLNAVNAVEITYNSGSDLVVGIDLLFKDANNSTIKVIESINKEKAGLADDTEYTVRFDKNKIFTVLSDDEILRRFDAIPLKAQAQTLMGNRLVLFNYEEERDLIDINGAESLIEYRTDLVQTTIGESLLTDRTASGNYSYNGAKAVSDSIVYFDLDGIELVQGGQISLSITIEHDSFDATVPTETIDPTDINLTFVLPRTYSDVFDLASSQEFKDAVGTATNILPVYHATDPTSCSGNTWTDIFNCLLPATLDTSPVYYKYDSGITAGGEPLSIIASTTSTEIGIQINAARYVDNVTTPAVNVYNYYTITSARAYFRTKESPTSLHSDRDYTILMEYLDEHMRPQGALASEDNVVYVPCSAMDTANEVKVTIPTTQVAPAWAKYYRFLMKADKEQYDTIFSRKFFPDPDSNAYYFLLEGENRLKVEDGDKLVVKSDTKGAVNECIEVTVLEKESKQANFIDVVNEWNPLETIPVPSGVYIKVVPTAFDVSLPQTTNIQFGNVNDTTADFLNEEAPTVIYPANIDPDGDGIYQDYTIPAGSIVKIRMKVGRRGFVPFACGKDLYTFEKEFVSTADYNSLYDWWDGDRPNLDEGGTYESGEFQQKNDNVFYDTLITRSYDPSRDSIPFTRDVNKFQFWRNTSTEQLWLVARSGTLNCPYTTNFDLRKSYFDLQIDVYRNISFVAFETLPSDTLPELFYEGNQVFSINASGEHQGSGSRDVNQDISGGTAGEVYLNFHNCYTFGNGVESYRIEDSFTKDFFLLGNRSATRDREDYSIPNRFAHMTWSGRYNDDTNLNKLNEFNRGLNNYKQLEESFGPVMMAWGRKTDILVLQEDKISYVLAGKNLLADAIGGGQITSIPEVFGTQIARPEEYGISNNPESFVSYGDEMYFTDAKRGAVIMLSGGDAQNLRVISDDRMTPWFRDEFKNTLGEQKVGGYDTYRREYVLAMNEEPVPISTPCLPCGTSKKFTATTTAEVTYCVDVGSLVGDVSIQYRGFNAETFNITAIYNATPTSTGIVSGSGTLTVSKNNPAITEIQITVQASSGDLEMQLNVNCPAAEVINVYEVVLTSDEEAGDTMHIEHRYATSPYVGPLQSKPVTFASGSEIVASRFTSYSGAQGIGTIPTDGSTVTMRSNKKAGDNFDFDSSVDRFLYLRSNTAYTSSQADLVALLAAATNATPITNPQTDVYQATFTMPSTGSNLYLIWDLRTKKQATLCYSNVSESDACCACP